MEGVMEIETINFDDPVQVELARDKVVQIPVTALMFLLQGYYSGGGEPNSLTERLRLAMEEYNVKHLSFSPK